MPKVKAFSVGWARLTFRTNDHPPPHFHAVRSDEWDVRIVFGGKKPEVAVASGRPNRRELAELRRLLKMALGSVEGLLEEWEDSRPTEDSDG